MLFSRWGNKHSVENRKTFSAKKGWVIKPWKDMEESKMHIAKSKKQNIAKATYWFQRCKTIKTLERSMTGDGGERD